MTYMTTGATYTIGTGYGIVIQVNAPLTGTITVKDGNNTVAVIASVVPVGQYYYYGFSGSISVIPSATTDSTVSVLNRQ